MSIQGALLKWFKSPPTFGKTRSFHAHRNVNRTKRILVPLRDYCTGDNRTLKDKNFPSWTAISWLTQSPDLLSIEDITSQIPSNVGHSSTNLNVPVILSTPAFASWIDPSCPVFENYSTLLLKSLFGKVPTRTRIFGILGVVDKIPLPEKWQACQRGEASDMRGIAALEGISMMLANRHSVKVELAGPAQRGSRMIDEPALTISADPSSPNSSTSEHTPPFEIGLRLANTVFVNGRDRTLLGVQWEYHPESGSYSLSQCHDLQGCYIQKPCDAVQSHLHIPLFPVSKRRKVIASMGNILRQISKSDDGSSNDPMPASAELEQKLPRHVIMDGVTTQRPSVWAVVEPSEVVNNVEGNTGTGLVDRIRNGAKIHRVVSGGGGWGKKQGLLSLDPEVSFTEQPRLTCTPLIEDVFQDSVLIQTPIGRPYESPGLGQSSEAFPLLSQVAKPGDYIQFFIYMNHKHNTPDMHVTQTGEITLTCNFSTTPSDDPGQNIPNTKFDDSLTIASTPHLITIKNYFGAASENAVTYSKDSLSRSLTSKTNGVSSRTKLSVPRSSVVLDIK